MILNNKGESLCEIYFYFHTLITKSVENREFVITKAAIQRAKMCNCCQFVDVFPHFAY